MELTVELPAGPIHYRVYDARDGQGETLVFVHGFAVDGRLWEPVALRLAAAGLRCIVPTWPFGSHTTPMNPGADVTPPGAARIIADFLAALDLEDVTIVGNDSGGAVTQLLVTSDPSRIGRLVLTNCDSFDNFPPGDFKRLSRLAHVPGAGWLVAQAMRFEPILRGPTAFGEVNAHRQPTELLRSFVAPLIRDRRIRRDALRFFGAADSKDTLAAAAKLPDLTMPALVVWGEDDTLFPVSDATRLQTALNGCELVLVPDAKTFSPLDQPEAVASAIAAFVASRPVGSSR
ncbi:alpha/beta fold hydrolase [Nocardioides marmorisolisilvae]|uniref:Alpha/beta hydrolase n=1 Tax=Nocardioides marmorisolisilvae TaxID=1542737 RepID=A0A3N0DZP9_9ACTN|nr:alpha/beta hydrolase [Nocardioides marmorisolisilvae]RNL80976.1 alpha/beta hydrolase [Nocardioides marmorisolisilvae]